MYKLENKHKSLNLDRFTLKPSTKDYKVISTNNEDALTFNDLNVVSMKVFYYLTNILIQNNGLEKNEEIGLSITDITKKTTGGTSGSALKNTRAALLKVVKSIFWYRADKNGDAIKLGLIFDPTLSATKNTMTIKFNEIYFKDIQFFKYLKDTELFLAPLKTKLEVQIYISILALKGKQKTVQKRHIVRFFRTLSGYEKSKNRNKLNNHKKALFSLAEKLKQDDNNLQLKIEGDYFYIL